MIYENNDSYKIYHGNMLEEILELEDNSIDSIVTDPPYELGFMGKSWDASGVAFQKDTWEKCFRVLKPGGHLLAFGGSRTYHRIACAIEDAGFELRDTIMWLYGSGFPKSMNIGKAVESYEKLGNASTRNKRKIEQACDGDSFIVKQTNNGAMGEIVEASRKHYTPGTENAKKWDGWGTCLKPAFEPVIVARKPLDGTCANNILTYGVGGLNIDECRIELEEDYEFKTTNRKSRSEDYVFNDKTSGFKNENNDNASANPQGRFPANVILTYDETDFDEVCGDMPITKSSGGKMSQPDLRDVGKKSKESIGVDKLSFGQVSNVERMESNYIAPSNEGSAARYFYCAKASKKDRDEGLEEFQEKKTGELQGGRKEGSAGSIKKNIHPTVKPTTLMQYLVRLVTPKGGTVLDPFMGSGSTGKATMIENVERNADYKFIGIEMTEDYLDIAKARIEFGKNWVKEEQTRKKSSKKPVAQVSNKAELW